MHFNKGIVTRRNYKYCSYKCTDITWTYQISLSGNFIHQSGKLINTKVSHLRLSFIAYHILKILFLDHPILEIVRLTLSLRLLPIFKGSLYSAKEWIQLPLASEWISYAHNLSLSKSSRRGNFQDFPVWGMNFGGGEAKSMAHLGVEWSCMLFSIPYLSSSSTWLLLNLWINLWINHWCNEWPDFLNYVSCSSQLVEVIPGTNHSLSKQRKKLISFDWYIQKFKEDGLIIDVLVEFILAK